MPKYAWFIAFLLAGCVAAGAAAASSRSQALIKQGVAALAARDNKAAIDKFRAAEKADPKDADAFYYEGKALNRANDFPSGLAALNRAQALRSRQADLDLETGYAMVMLGGHAAEAAAALEAHEKAHPGDARTSLLLGRAYFQMKQYDRAETTLKQAWARDPRMKPYYLYFMIRISADRGNGKAAFNYYHQLQREAPNSVSARLARQQLAAGIRRARGGTAAKPWSVILSEGVGWNTNVVPKGSAGTTLPTGITRKSSLFSQTTLDAVYNYDATSADRLSPRYVMTAMVFPQLRQYNMLDQNVTVDYRHIFRSDIFGTFRLGDEYTTVGGAAFRNQVELRPAASHRYNDWLAVELAYDVAVSKYHFPSAAGQDRSGNLHTIAPTAFWSWPGTRWTGRAGYSWAINRSNGTDFRYVDNGLVLEVNHPVIEHVSGTLLVTYDHQAYTHIGVTSAVHRTDNVTAALLQLVRPIAGPLNAFGAANFDLSVYGRYQYLIDDSNVPFFNYRQQQISAGLIARF